MLLHLRSLRGVCVGNASSATAAGVRKKLWNVFILLPVPPPHDPFYLYNVVLPSFPVSCAKGTATPVVTEFRTE